MKIIVSGTEKEIESGYTISRLIEEEKVENPEYVTIVINDDLVEKDTYQARELNEGDKVEFLYYMGGGR